MSDYHLEKILGGFAVAIFLASQAEAKNWNCPDVEKARADFASGEAKSWPYYTEADAARVQRQHAETGITAQAKYFPWMGNGTGTCQYYNHVGLIFTFVVADAGKGVLSPNNRWRSEWTESYPEQDKLGKEMLEVCMKTVDGLEWPSVECSFDLED